MREATRLEHEAIIDVSNRIIEILKEEGRPMDAFNILAVTVARIEIAQGKKDQHMKNIGVFAQCILGNIEAMEE